MHDVCMVLGSISLHKAEILFLKCVSFFQLLLVHKHFPIIFLAKTLHFPIISPLKHTFSSMFTVAFSHDFPSLSSRWTVRTLLPRCQQRGVASIGCCAMRRPSSSRSSWSLDHQDGEMSAKKSFGIVLG